MARVGPFGTGASWVWMECNRGGRTSQGVCDAVPSRTSVAPSGEGMGRCGEEGLGGEGGGPPKGGRAATVGGVPGAEDGGVVPTMGR